MCTFNLKCTSWCQLRLVAGRKAVKCIYYKGKSRTIFEMLGHVIHTSHSWNVHIKRKLVLHLTSWWCLFRTNRLEIEMGWIFSLEGHILGLDSMVLSARVFMYIR